MSGGSSAPARFGLIGVFVVAAIIVVIDLNTGGGEANPKTTLALIFGVLAVFLVILFALQRSDLNRVAGADARGTAGVRPKADGRSTTDDDERDRPLGSDGSESGSTPRRSRRAGRCGRPGGAARTWRSW